MKANLLNFMATIFIAALLSQVLPWWSVMLASFITSVLFSLNKSAVFFVPFLAIAVFWIFYSFWLGNSNDFVLAKKIAVLLPLKGNTNLLILVTGLIGGLAAGVSAIFGKQCVAIIKSSNP